MKRVEALVAVAEVMDVSTAVWLTDCRCGCGISTTTDGDADSTGAGTFMASSVLFGGATVNAVTAEAVVAVVAVMAVVEAMVVSTVVWMPVWLTGWGCDCECGCEVSASTNGGADSTGAGTSLTSCVLAGGATIEAVAAGAVVIFTLTSVTAVLIDWDSSMPDDGTAV